jgi:hypothetical protein
MAVGLIKVPQLAYINRIIFRTVCNGCQVPDFIIVAEVYQQECDKQGYNEGKYFFGVQKPWKDHIPQQVEYGNGLQENYNRSMPYYGQIVLCDCRDTIIPYDAPECYPCQQMINNPLDFCAFFRKNRIETHSLSDSVLL